MGYTGPDCSIRDCPNACNNNGICMNGVCQCEKGYRGMSCEDRYVYNGKIVDGAVVCDKRYTGVICDELLCDDSCNNNGLCQNGTCYCRPGYMRRISLIAKQIH